MYGEGWVRLEGLAEPSSKTSRFYPRLRYNLLDLLFNSDESASSQAEASRMKMDYSLRTLWDAALHWISKLCD
jgi:hypothetical protein